MLLKDRVAFVTGASGGIGSAIVKSFAREGAHLALLEHKQSLSGLMDELKSVGVQAKSYRADMTSVTEMQQCVKNVVADFARIDILVNNAGITADNLLLLMKEQEWDSVLNTNLKSMFVTTKCVARQMLKQQDGRVINISSVSGITGNAGQSNYAAAKAGIIGFSKSVARELASRNIRVNVVAPGFIATKMTEPLPDEVKEKVKAEIPLKRFGKPSDVAEMCAYLASEKAAYITGQVFVVDGGISL